MSEEINGWKTQTLGSVIELIGGGTPKTSILEYWNGDIPWLSVVDFNVKNKYVFDTEKTITKKGLENSSSKMLKSGDIIISARGTVGALAVLGLPMAFNQSCYGIRGIEWQSITDYIYYLLKDTVAGLKQISHGGVFDTITRETFNSITVLLPSLPEQKAIANVLSSLDDKIDLLHRQNETLESMAETLFRQWFIEEAQEGWGKYSVSDFADHVKENVVPAKSKSEYYHHYSLPAFDEGKRPTLELGSEILSNKYKVVEHSILVSKLNPKVPRIWPVSSLPSKNSICSTEFQVLKPKSIKLYGYLLFLLRSNEAVDALSMAASGTSGSHQRVRPEDIFNIKTSLPSLASAEQYSDMVIPGIAKTSSNLSQIETLEKIRDTLLPKLMSGEVRVEV